MTRARRIGVSCRAVNDLRRVDEGRHLRPGNTGDEQTLTVFRERLRSLVAAVERRGRSRTVSVSRKRMARVPDIGQVLCDAICEVSEALMRSIGRVVLAIGAMSCLVPPQLGSAQTSTTTETKKFEVIAREGNELVVKVPEGTRKMTVLNDYKFFTVNGRALSVYELKPGMKGTATITAKTRLTPVSATEIKDNTVARADRREVSAAVGTTWAEGASASAPAAAPSATKLPRTVGLLPLFGFTGLAALAIGAMLAIRRRRLAR